MRERTVALPLGLTVLSVVLAVILLASCAPPPEGSAEDPGPPERGTFLILGQEMELEYRWVDGHKVFAGDVVLGPEDEVAGPAGGTGRQTSALWGQTGDSHLWPGGKVPYTIASSVTSAHRTLIHQAIHQWQTETSIRFTPRNGESAYVTFTENPGTTVCKAQLGHVAHTRRYIYLRDTRHSTPCNLGVMVHEMGHTLSLIHEHQRPERDHYVEIISHCIPSGLGDAFTIIRSGARTFGPYDIKSTMHYRSTTLTNGCYPIRAKDGSPLLHDWSTLSSGDIRAIEALYGGQTPSPAPAPAPSPDPAPDAGPPPAADAPDGGSPDASGDDAGAGAALPDGAGGVDESSAPSVPAPPGVPTLPAPAPAPAPEDPDAGPPTVAPSADPGATFNAPSPPAPNDLSGGCSIAVAATAPTPWGVLLLLTALVALTTCHRRRRPSR
jgi:hypothetical protein